MSSTRCYCDLCLRCRERYAIVDGKQRYGSPDMADKDIYHFGDPLPPGSVYHNPALDELMENLANDPDDIIGLPLDKDGNIIRD